MDRQEWGVNVSVDCEVNKESTVFNTGSRPFAERLTLKICTAQVPTKKKERRKHESYFCVLLGH
jgi:hypothetical protein